MKLSVGGTSSCNPDHVSAVTFQRLRWVITPSKAPSADGAPLSAATQPADHDHPQIVTEADEKTGSFSWVTAACASAPQSCDGFGALITQRDRRVWLGVFVWIVTLERWGALDCETLVGVLIAVALARLRVAAAPVEGVEA